MAAFLLSLNKPLLLEGLLQARLRFVMLKTILSQQPGEAIQAKLTGTGTEAQTHEPFISLECQTVWLGMQNAVQEHIPAIDS